MRNRSPAALAASPLLVGAVTLLVAFVAVFLAYNANSGLPFVPTYDLKAELPTGSKLVKGNDVRVGGFRVGFVERLRPGARNSGRAVAIVDMKLDKQVEPLARGTRARVRPRSPLGIKFIELTPGRSEDTFAAGDTIGLAQTSASLEFEDLYDAFPPRVREGLRGATEGLGDALAGRGESVNESVGAAAPFLRRLTPVMATLADRRTRLGRLVRELGAATAPRPSRRSTATRPRWPRHSSGCRARWRRAPPACARAAAFWATPPSWRSGCACRRRSSPARCRRSPPRWVRARRCCRARSGSAATWRMRPRRRGS